MSKYKISLTVEATDEYDAYKKADTELKYQLDHYGHTTNIVDIEKIKTK